jgi:hypothetical protein
MPQLARHILSNAIMTGIITVGPTTLLFYLPLPDRGWKNRGQRSADTNQDHHGSDLMGDCRVRLHLWTAPLALG